MKRNLLDFCRAPPPPGRGIGVSAALNAVRARPCARPAAHARLTVGEPRGPENAAFAGSRMNPTIVGMIVFGCTFGGALLAMWLRTTLPEHHLDKDSRDTVKTSIGLIATMTALVLGLVTASAKSSFDAVDTAVKQTAAELLALDRVLARYGSETGKIRKRLQDTIGARIDIVWPQRSFKPGSLETLAAGAWLVETERFADAIRG